MAGLTSPAHGDTGELGSLPTGNEVGSAHRDALAAMDCCRIPMSETLGACLLSGEPDISAVPRPEISRSGARMHGLDHGPLGGDEAAARARGECDDLVAGPICGARRADELGQGASLVFRDSLNFTTKPNGCCRSQAA